MVDFRISKFLASIFTPDFNLSNSLAIANLVVELAGEYIGGEPMILPIPQDAPAEIPRINFISPDKSWKVNISLDRVNMFYDAPIGSQEEPISAEIFASIISEFFSKYHERLNLRVQRLGFVSHRLIIDENTLEFLLDRFCNKDQTGQGKPFDNPKRFEIHSLKKYPWGDFNINSWVRMKFLPIIIGEGEIRSGFKVENDLNTFDASEDPDVNFSENETKQFFHRIPGHVDEILKLYFE